MSKLNKIRTLLQSVLATFARISTDKALIEWDGEDELEVGMAVHGIDEEGNEFALEDGDYKAEDGTIYRVSEGVVTEIIESDGEQVSETPGDDVQPEDETREEENAEEEPAQEPEAEPAENPAERIANLEAEVARLEEELGAARERIAELERENEELKNKPAAESATDEFEKVVKAEKTGNKRLDNLNRILNA